jgi:hypothetical protein
MPYLTPAEIRPENAPEIRAPEYKMAVLNPSSPVEYCCQHRYGTGYDGVPASGGGLAEYDKFPDLVWFTYSSYTNKIGNTGTQG